MFPRVSAIFSSRSSAVFGNPSQQPSVTWSWFGQQSPCEIPTATQAGYMASAQDVDSISLYTMKISYECYEALHSITDSKSHYGMSVWHKGIVRKYPEKQLKGEELVRRFGQLLQLQLSMLHSFRFAWLSHASAAIHTSWYRKCRLCRCSLCCFLCILRDVQNALLGHVDHLKLASVTWVMIFKHQTNSNNHHIEILPNGWCSQDSSIPGTGQILPTCSTRPAWSVEVCIWNQTIAMHSPPLASMSNIEQQCKISSPKKSSVLVKASCFNFTFLDHCCCFFNCLLAVLGPCNSRREPRRALQLTEWKAYNMDGGAHQYHTAESVSSGHQNQWHVTQCDTMWHTLTAHIAACSTS